MIDAACQASIVQLLGNQQCVLLGQAVHDATWTVMLPKICRDPGAQIFHHLLQCARLPPHLWQSTTIFSDRPQDPALDNRDAVPHTLT